MMKSRFLIILAISSVSATLVLSKATLGQPAAKVTPFSQWAQTNKWWVDAHPTRAQYFYSHPSEADTYRNEWFGHTSSEMNAFGSHAGDHTAGGEHHGEHHHEHHAGDHHHEHLGADHHSEHHGGEHHGEHHHEHHG